MTAPPGRRVPPGARPARRPSPDQAPPSDPDPSPDPTLLLRAAGLRVTAPRVAVLQVIAERPHSDADTVRCGVLERLGTVSTQAVYDVLGALTAAGLLRRIEPAGSPARYERRTSPDHHHLVCRTCGAMEDSECIVRDEDCVRPARTHGFSVEETEVIWWGTCPACRATAGPSA